MEEYTMSDIIISSFYKKMAGVQLDAYGILDSTNKIHTFGTDSKIIGRIFEMLTQPVLEQIAVENGLILRTPKSQTIYPDFILMKNEHSKNKIAIDIKSTYINTDQSKIQFTLGAFGSYMRDNTNNIEYEYTDYSKHYVIGFVYKRNDSAQESHVYDYENRSHIKFSYCDVKYFIQEKYKIAGDKPGSGNTENIGSFPTKQLDDLKEGKGPFAILGQDVFDLYWKYYPKYRTAVKTYKSLDEFVDWLPNNIDNIKLLHEFDSKEVLRKINLYKNIHKNNASDPKP